MIRWQQAKMGFTDFGLDHDNPDIVKYAEPYGANGHRVETAEGLLPLLEHCIKPLGVHVIDCTVDYSENDRILNAELREYALPLAGNASGQRPPFEMRQSFRAGFCTKSRETESAPLGS